MSAASPPSAPSPIAMAPTGITVVTGMLGAGKTTLVNYVLNADHGYRVAVILNEFGAELGVEKMLVQDKPDGDAAVEEWVEMNNGCVCCTVKGSLIQTIDNLLERRAATGRKFDFILLETTGLADPGPVAQELWVDDELLDDDCAILDAVVTLVDASNVHRQLRENKETALQIAFADTLVLNKTDLVSGADLEEVEHTLAGINADARVVRATRSVVDLRARAHQGAVTVAGRRGRNDARRARGGATARGRRRGSWILGEARSGSRRRHVGASEPPRYTTRVFEPRASRWRESWTFARSRRVARGALWERRANGTRRRRTRRRRRIRGRRCASGDSSREGRVARRGGGRRGTPRAAGGAGSVRNHGISARGGGREVDE